MVILAVITVACGGNSPSSPSSAQQPSTYLRSFSVSAVQRILRSNRDSRLVGKDCSFGDSLTVTRAYRRAEAPLSPADRTMFEWMHGYETGDANGFTLAGGAAITARSGGGWYDAWIDEARHAGGAANGTTALETGNRTSRSR